jgi:hypothetical protein
MTFLRRALALAISALRDAPTFSHRRRSSVPPNAMMWPSVVEALAPPWGVPWPSWTFWLAKV